MSRFQRHQSKQFTYTFLGVLFLFLLIIFFIFSVGLKILLNTSVFVSHLFSKKEEKTNLAKLNNNLEILEINDIPYATNSPQIAISGSVLNLETLDFYLNEKRVKSLASSAKDSFSEIIDGLEKGKNEVYIVGKNRQFNTEKKTQKYQVVYKNEKPKLEIKEPQDHSSTTKPEVKVAGTTDKETFIKINSLPVVVDAVGNFETTLRLKEGENKIEITAQDTAQNIDQKIITVSYQKEE